MHLKHKSVYILILLITLNIGCRKENQVNKAIYYWKSTFEINHNNLKYLNNSGINRMYVRMFDVTWNKEHNRSKPEAIIKFKNSFPDKIDFVPVIYIANDVFRHEDNIKQLSKNFSNLLNSLTQKNQLKYNEIQIDCDWTITTKEKVFQLSKTYT
jgi:hypothetical protein